MTTTIGLIAEIDEAQAQKALTANAAFRALEQEVHDLASVAIADGANTVLGDPVPAYRAAQFLLTGALTADRTLIVPARVRSNALYRNNTTGGHNVIVKTAAGSGVVIAPGDEMPLRCDGTNVLVSGDFYYRVAAAFLGVIGSAFGANKLVLQHVFDDRIRFAAGLPRSAGYANPAAAAAASWTVQGSFAGGAFVTIGTVNFATGAPAATFTWSADQVFNPGDVLRIITPSPSDATLGNVSINLVGVKS